MQMVEYLVGRERTYEQFGT